MVGSQQQGAGVIEQCGEHLVDVFDSDQCCVNPVEIPSGRWCNGSGARWLPAGSRHRTRPGRLVRA
jgi:hypothetical protein